MTTMMNHSFAYSDTSDVTILRLCAVIPPAGDDYYIPWQQQQALSESLSYALPALGFYPGADFTSFPLQAPAIDSATWGCSPAGAGYLPPAGVPSVAWRN